VSAIAKGRSAPFAWRRAFRAHAESLATLKNELLAPAANDVRDVGERVLRLLTAPSRTARTPRPDDRDSRGPDAIDIANLDRTRVVDSVRRRRRLIPRIHPGPLPDITAVAGIDPAALERRLRAP